jgi:tetrahydromethanopterin S-methyltransferase subunit G
MSPDENKKLDRIENKLDEVVDCQQDICETQENIKERLEQAEKITDPALELARRIGNKVANVFVYGFIIGLVGFLIWLAKSLGVYKLIGLIK